MSADYLFQTDKCYDCSYDTGDKVIQCGRHNDIFKFWLQWRSRGMKGFERQINRLMDLTQYQVAKMKAMPEKFHLITPDPECTNVSFWYVPKRLRDEKKDHYWEDELGKCTSIIKGRMMKKGSMMVSYQPLGRIPNFFRSIISNQAQTEEDIDFMLEEIDALGCDL
jgi:glutamate decarboxylase